MYRNMVDRLDLTGLMDDNGSTVNAIPLSLYYNEKEFRKLLKKNKVVTSDMLLRLPNGDSGILVVDKKTAKELTNLLVSNNLVFTYKDNKIVMGIEVVPKSS